MLVLTSTLHHPIFKQTEMKKVRIILGSNHELWWDGLQLLLNKSRGFEVLAACFTAKGLINRVSRLKPDLVMFDKDLDGEKDEITRSISRLHPDIKMVVIIRYYQDINFNPGFNAVERAYIDKNITFPELVHCLQYVAERKIGFFYSLAGQRYFENVVNKLSESEKMFIKDNQNVFNFTQREQEILDLLAKKGLSNKQIADSMGITQNTVKAHLKNIFDKMHVSNRQQAVISAKLYSYLKKPGPAAGADSNI
jgi:DNA-binding NarL/FixJ family response regulator